MSTQTPHSTARVIDSDTEGVPSFEASGGDWSGTTLGSRPIAAATVSQCRRYTSRRSFASMPNAAYSCGRSPEPRPRMNRPLLSVFTDTAPFAI